MLFVYIYIYIYTYTLGIDSRKGQKRFDMFTGC